MGACVYVYIRQGVNLVHSYIDLKILDLVKCTRCVLVKCTGRVNSSIVAFQILLKLGVLLTFEDLHRILI